MTQGKMIRYLLFQQILVNPLPWRVERGWAYEVIASNDVVVVNCQTHEEAEEIILVAEKIKMEMDNIHNSGFRISTENISDLNI